MWPSSSFLTARSLFALPWRRAITVRAVHRPSIREKLQRSIFVHTFLPSGPANIKGARSVALWTTWFVLLGSHVFLLHAQEVDEKKHDRGKIVVEKASFRELLAFEIDDYLHTTKHPRLTILGASIGLLLLTGALSFHTASGVKLSVVESLWIAWTNIVDPGTHTMIPKGQGRMRSIAVVFTLGGLLVFAELIGLMTDGINNLLNEVPSTCKKVLVHDHVLMLGYSRKIHSMLSGAGDKCKTYVALAEKPIEGMEDIGFKKEARVIFRNGDPSVVSDVANMSPNTAKSIIIFSPDIADDDEADARVMARTMALVSLDVTAPIVVELRDKDNLTVVRQMLQSAPGHKLQVVPLAGADIVGNILVQGALQSGLVKVFHHLLDSDSGQGNEIQLQCIDKWPQVEGRTYGEAVFMFDDAIVLGVMADRLTGSGDSSVNNCMLLNPPDDLIMQKGDKICALAKDANSFGPRMTPVCHPLLRASHCTAVVQPLQVDHQPKKLLIFNWRDDMEDIFREIDKRVGKGSTVTVVSGYSEEDRDRLLEMGGGLRELQNIKINHEIGQTVKQSVVKRIMSKTHYDGVMVFSSASKYDPSTADARAAVCSLLVESMLKPQGTAENDVNAGVQRSRINHQACEVITEIQDRRSLQLIRVAGVSEFVIANELSGMMMVSLAHAPDLRHFWLDNVLSDRGNNIVIDHVESFVHGFKGEELAKMTFWDLFAACRVQGATPIALKRASKDRTYMFNPPDKATPLKLAAEDIVVTLACNAHCGGIPAGTAFERQTCKVDPELVTQSHASTHCCR